jgi:hypothetical protein
VGTPLRIRVTAHFALALGLAAAACGSGGAKKPRERRDGGPGGSIRVIDDKTGISARDEKEPNDEAGNAQPLTPPAAVRGRIEKAGDRDVYQLEIQTPGTLSARLTAVEDADLILDLEDVTGSVLASADAGPAKTAEGIPNYAVKPGTYRIAIREFVKRPKKGKAVPRSTASAPYTLQVELGAPPAEGDEVEPNDDVSYAGDLPLGGAARGFIGWNKDVDVFRVSLEGAGDDVALSIDVDGVPRLGLRVAVLDATGALLIERQGRTGEPVALRNVAIKDGDTLVYVSLTAAKGNDTDRYVVHAGTVPFELDEEAEPNDKPATANPLSDVPGADGGTRVGFLGRSDADCFKLDPAPADRRLSASVEPPGEVDAELTVVDPAGAPLVPAANKGKRGAAERVADVRIPASAPAFVCAKALAGDSATDRYRLRWSVVPDEAVLVPGMEEE